MIQIKSIITAVLGLTVATCTPIVQRSAATVLTDLATIGTDLSTLTTAVQSYAGGLTDALVIATDETTLDTAINQATTDATAATSFSASDSTSVVAAVASLAPKITTGLSALASKESLFAASGLDSLVLSLLQTLQTDTDALGAALQAKAQSTDVATLKSYQTQIDAGFASVIAVY
ncbi:uncharacterized protein K444DRAFT_658473 [Hyaloscypha bicolor E]|uniref:Hydrophobic surface binding protein A n=1 Tax=Hyaloscypha bicolor E TaxID=1095630 RepID=A0A2J6TWN0_9HELO|nr:uncharacterized protein K444DRAFT_658473 [Hyaloscypha bicolor E]PMD67417.1 hypothetical protein K444DRAFT_658473 [Hyaloscypha bicolor E]